MKYFMPVLCLSLMAAAEPRKSSIVLHTYSYTAKGNRHQGILSMSSTIIEMRKLTESSSIEILLSKRHPEKSMVKSELFPK